MNLNELSKVVHAANIKWWQDIDTGAPIERNRCELIALVITELSEALEAERKNLMDDHLPHRRMAEVEMADAKIRLLDYCGGFGIRLRDPVPMKRPTPENKAEAIFRIVETLVSVPTSYTSGWIDYAFAQIEAYCEKHGYDLSGAMEEKIAYNKSRADHTHAARMAEGGKKF